MITQHSRLMPKNVPSAGIRIIAGERRGKKLLTVNGKATRPTANRVRESLFNIIATHIGDARVLDLFAGTGIWGIEALSRGARSVLFVDKEKASIEIIRRNLCACRYEPRAKIFQQDIQRGLQWLKNEGPPFNLVFLDPPYNSGLVNTTLRYLFESNVMTSNALIVVEHSTKEPLFELMIDFKQIDQRNYGKTLVSFIHSII